jgi:hypothetical protein
MSDAACSLRRPERRGSSVRRWAVAAATLVVACTVSTGAPDPGPKVETTFPPSDPQEENDFSEGLSVVDLDPENGHPPAGPSNRRLAAGSRMTFQSTTSCSS